MKMMKLEYNRQLSWYKMTSIDDKMEEIRVLRKEVQVLEKQNKWLTNHMFNNGYTGGNY